MAGAGDAERACGWGRWQARLALLLALPVLLTGMYGTNYVFLAAHTDHRYRATPLIPSNDHLFSVKYTILRD